MAAKFRHPIVPTEPRARVVERRVASASEIVRAGLVPRIEGEDASARLADADGRTRG